MVIRLRHARAPTGNMDNLFNARTFSTIWFHIDDIVALLVATPILVSFVQHFYLPPKREPGYDLFFISPQSRDGIVRGPKGRQSQNSRDISEVLSSPVGNHLSMCVLLG